MTDLATLICLSAYALGWGNAEQICLNADTVVEAAVVLSLPVLSNMKVALCMYNAGPRNCRFGGVKWRGNSYGRRVLKTSKTFRDKMISFQDQPEAEVF